MTNGESPYTWHPRGFIIVNTSPDVGLILSSKTCKEHYQTVEFMGFEILYSLADVAKTWLPGLVCSSYDG